jgi:hypothetical protein
LSYARLILLRSFESVKKVCDAKNKSLVNSIIQYMYCNIDKRKTAHLQIQK